MTTDRHRDHRGRPGRPARPRAARRLAPDVLVAVGLADCYARFDVADRAARRGLERPGRLGGRGGRRRRRVRDAPWPGPAARPSAPSALPGPARRGDRAAPRRRPARPDRPRPARPHRIRARRLAEGARDPARRGPAVRLDRRRDRPPEGGPRGRDGARPQPGPAHRARATASSGRDGTIGQYSLGGPANKRTILAGEGLDPDGSSSSRRPAIRYIGSDTTHIFCLPTCRHARRITDAHRVRSARWPGAGRAAIGLPRLPAGLGRGLRRLSAARAGRRRLAVTAEPA